MKRFVCELCGSMEIVKNDEMFICQSCGCRYSLEDARNLLVEVEDTAPIASVTAKADNSEAIGNYLKMARNALQAENNGEAENYSNKIIELDPTHSEAWEIKGEVAGWQSTGANNKMLEAVNAWVNAIEYADASEKTAVRERVASKFENLFIAMISLRANNFGTLQTEANKESTKRDASNGFEMMNTLAAKSGVLFNRAEIQDTIARIIMNGAITGYNDAVSEFGPEHINMSKWAWERFYQKGDLCVELLLFAGAMARSRSVGENTFTNMIKMAQTIRDSKSWKFDVNSWTYDNYVEDYAFTTAAKEQRNTIISRYRKMSEKFNTDIMTDALEMLQGDRVAEEKEAAKAAYWAENAERKDRLDREKKAMNQFASKMDRLISEIPELPLIEEKNNELQTIESQISSQKEKLSKLGVFKGKEKKATQDEIDRLIGSKRPIEEALKELEEKKNAESSRLEGEKNKALNRISEIEEELNKDRGQISITGEWAISDAIADGKFNFTPEQFAEHFKQLLPSNYFCEDIEDNDAEFVEAWKKSVYFNLKDKDVLDDDGNPDNAGVQIGFVLDDNEKITQMFVRSTVIERIGAEGATKFALIGSKVLLSIISNMSMSEAERIMCSVVASEDQSLFMTEGGVNIQYARKYTELIFGTAIDVHYAIISLK